MRLSTFQAGKGHPLLLLHAFPLNGQMWEHQITDLSYKYKVIAPDLPGFGGSGEILHPYTMEICANALFESVEAMHLPKVAVCGISMGGYIAFELWRKYSEKISALILADTRAEADSTEARQNRERQISLINSGKEKEVLKALTEKLLSDHTRQTSPEVFEKITAISSGVTPEALIATIDGLAGRRDSTGLLATITVPTLIMVGESDTLTPPSAALFMHQNIPGSELHVIPKAGHLPPLEQPALFNKIVSAFLDKIL
jgi:pimeloyl-ACP methyl ester carboxylesterase